MVRLYNLLPLIIRLRDSEASGQFGIDPILAQVTDALLQEEVDDHVALIAGMRDLLSALQSPEPFRTLLFQMLGQQRAEGWTESLERFFLSETVPWHKIAGTVEGWRKSLSYRAADAYDFVELFKTEVNEIGDYAPRRNATFPFRAARVAITPAGLSPYDWSTDTITEVPPYIPAPPAEPDPEPEPEPGPIDYDIYVDSPYDEQPGVYDLMKVDANTRRAALGRYGYATAIQDDWAFIGTGGDNIVDVYRRSGGSTFSPVRNEIQRISLTFGAGTFHVTVPGHGTTTGVTESTSAASFQAKLEDVVGVGNVEVTGGPLSEEDFLVEFKGDLAGVNVGIMTTDADPTATQDNSIFVPYMVQTGDSDVSELVLRYRLEDSALAPEVISDIRANPANYRIRFEIGAAAEVLGTVSTGTSYPVSDTETPDASANDLSEMMIGLWDYPNDTPDTVGPARLFSEEDITLSGTLATEVTLRLSANGIYRGYDLNEAENVIRLGVFNATTTTRLASLAFVEQRGSFSDDHSQAITDGMTIQRLELVPAAVPTTGSGIRLKVGSAVTSLIAFEPSPNPTGLSDGAWLGWRIAYALCEAMQKPVPAIPDTLGISLLDAASISNPITAAALEAYLGSATLDPSWYDISIYWLAPHANNYGKSGLIYGFNAQVNSASTGLSLSPEIWTDLQSPQPLSALFADLSELADHLNLLITRAGIVGSESTEMQPYSAANVFFDAVGNNYGNIPQIIVRFVGNGYLGTAVPLIEVYSGDVPMGVEVSTVQNGYSQANLNTGSRWTKVQTLSPGYNEIQRVEVVTPSEGGNLSFTLTVPSYGTSSAITETANRNQMKAALESVVGVGNIRATGGPLPLAPIDVEFVGDLVGTNIGLMTTDANPEPPADPAFTPHDVQDARTDYTHLKVTYDLDDSGLSPADAAEIISNPGAYYMRFEIEDDTQLIMYSQQLATNAGEGTIRSTLVDDFEWQTGTTYATNGFAPVKIFTEGMIEVIGSLSTSCRVRFVSGIFACFEFPGTTPGLRLAVYTSSGSLVTRLGLVTEAPTGVNQNFPAADIEWATIKKLSFNGDRPTTGGMRLRMGSYITSNISFEIDDPPSAPPWGTVEQLKSRILGYRIGRALSSALYPSDIAPNLPETIHFVFTKTTAAGGGSVRVNIPYPFTAADIDSVMDLADLANYRDAGFTLVCPRAGFFPPDTGAYNLQDRITSFDTIFSTGLVEATYIARSGTITDDALSGYITDLDTFADYLTEAVESAWISMLSNVVAGHYQTGYPSEPGLDHDRQYRLFFFAGLYGQVFPEIEILSGSGSDLTIAITGVQDGSAATDSQFGRSLAVWLEQGIAYPNGYLAIGAPNDRNGSPAVDAAGAIFIYRLNDSGQWVYHQKLVDPLLATGSIGYQFGLFVDIDGTVVVAGCIRDTEAGANSGAAYVFRDWTFEQRLTPDSLTGGDLFGGGVSVDGVQVAVSARRNGNAEGAVFIFEYSGGVWTQTHKVTAPSLISDGQFGRGVSLRGDFLFTSAKRLVADGNEGAAYAYERDNFTLSHRFMPPHGETLGQFGRFLSSDRNGTRLLVAEPNLTVSGRDSAGVAHLFVYDNEVSPELGTRWRYVQEVRPFGPNNLNDLDFFSEALAVSNDNAVIGAARHDFDADGLNPLDDAGAAWFYQIFGVAPPEPDLPAAIVCDGFAIIPVGILDMAFESDDSTSIVVTSGTNYAPQVIIPPPPEFIPEYDRIILRVRAYSTNGTLHATTSILPDDVRTKFIDAVGGIREFELVWSGHFNIDFSDPIYVNFHAAPGIGTDVYITAAELVVRQTGTAETSCLDACECLCQSTAETGSCHTGCEANCQTGCEASAQNATEASLQYELATRIEVDKCLGNTLHFLDAMSVMRQYLFDQRPIHVLPVYCVTIVDMPEVVGDIGDETSGFIIGKFSDRVATGVDVLTIRPDCTQGCQVSCETFCEVGCEDDCQGIGPCENSCQLRCEALCQTDCELVCQAGCVISCQADACQSICQGACEAVCQIACENFCQGACEVSGCQLSCTGGCEDSCQFACQQTCEFDCQSPAERGCATSCQEYCQVCCEEECEAGSCQTDCQLNGCQTACQIVCQQSCTFTCETNCQGSCEDPCEVLCQQACEGSCQSECENNCQQNCEGGGCEVACEGGCQSGCQSSCEATCEGASCQSTCEESGCQSCCECQCQSDGCQQECTSGCTSGCQTGCESACQAAGGCETGCEASCEGSSESCEDCCEICCEEYTEYACTTDQESACQEACQINSQGPCETVCEAQACETICQTPCESVCQAGGIEGCGALESIA